MQVIMELIFGMMMIAFALERAVEFLFNMQPFCSLNERFKGWKLKNTAAFIGAMAIAYFTKLDIIYVFLNKPELTGITGMIFTALLLAGGANVFSDIMKLIKNAKDTVSTGSTVATNSTTDTKTVSTTTIDSSTTK